MARRLAESLIVVALLAGAARASDPFEQEVVPVLVRHCAGCHNSSDPAGGLDLTRRDGALAGGDSGSPAIVPGDAKQSLLLERIRDGEMPPEGQGRAVAPEDQQRLEAWIGGGAAWPANRVLSPFEFTTDTRAGLDWWSLAPPRRPTLPRVKNMRRVRTPVDAFVLAQLEERGFSLASDADRATLIRRASFDLIGLPPTPEQVQAFVADPAPDAYERLIDRLLASPHYGERWARHWLDVVRFAESNGYETNTARTNAWPYRDWVIRAMNQDMDYRRFILEQLAGDQFGADAATGMLVGGPHDTVKSPDIGLTLQQRMNDLDDMITTTAGAFLGLTVGCAKCHDHKFDPVSQKDYYALQAIFAGVEHGERELRTPDSDRRKRRAQTLRAELADLRSQIDSLWMRHQPIARVGASPNATLRPAVRATINVDRFEPVVARMVRFAVLATNQSEPCLDELEVFAADDPQRNVALASHGAIADASGTYAGGTTKLHRLEHINDGKYGNGRSWISHEDGAGWVRIEWPEPIRIDRVVWARDREGKYSDRLPTRYKIEVSAAGNQWQTVATSEDRKSLESDDDGSRSAGGDALAGLPPDVAEEYRQLKKEAASLQEQIAALAPRIVYAGAFKQPEATHVLYRGEPLQKREPVAPGGIASVGDPLRLPDDASDAQRRLALARWIGSDSNPLTARGGADPACVQQVRRRRGATTRAPGWGGGRPSHPELLDWLATELVAQGWRLKSLHRTIMLSSTYRQASNYRAAPAKADRDGTLLWRYGPRRLEAEAIRDAMLRTSGVLDVRMGGPGYDVFEPNTNYVKVYKPKSVFTPAEWRRMVYQNKPRMEQDATFGAFDCPDASQAMARRNVSTTALQSLNMLNSPFVVQQAEQLAERLRRDAGDDVDAQIERGFRLAFGRDAEADERSAARQLIEAHGLTVFCRALFNASEFLYVN